MPPHEIHDIFAVSGELEVEPACGRYLKFSEVGEGEGAKVHRMKVEVGNGEGEEAQGRQYELLACRPSNAPGSNTNFEYVKE